jgi:hypothetical protein
LTGSKGLEEGVWKDGKRHGRTTIYLNRNPADDTDKWYEEIWQLGVLIKQSKV